MYLYLGNNPRSLYLVTSSHDERHGCPRKTLVFRAGEGQSKAIVEFLPKNQVDLSNCLKLTNRIVKGCLGLISVDNGLLIDLCRSSNLLIRFLDLFLAVITSATEVGNTRPSARNPEIVARIHEVSFYSLTSPLWDDLSTQDPQLSPDITESTFRDSLAQPTPPSQVFEHPCMPLTKILSSGSFYYAINSQWDLSSRLAVRLAREPNTSKEALTFDERFVWNEYIIRSLLDFRERLEAQDREDLDRCQFIVSFLCHSVKCLPMNFLLDLSNSRLRRCFYDGFTGSSH